MKILRPSEDLAAPSVKRVDDAEEIITAVGLLRLTRLVVGTAADVVGIIEPSGVARLPPLKVDAGPPEQRAL
jgi:hypothetical protein